jgi:hypothetical protein
VLKVTLKHAGLEATSSRPYHTPTRVKSLAVAAAEQEKPLSIDEMLEHFNLERSDCSHLVSRIKLPANQPVHGLSFASFNGLSAKDCRQLINQAHQMAAEKHQQNFAIRKKYLDGHLSSVDRLLKEFYAKAEAPRVREAESIKIARFIEFLNLRRQEIELLGKRAYEEYLIEFKCSLAELEYFEKTLIGGEKFDEAFFASNTAARTQALQDLDNRFVEEIAANQQKLREKFAADEPAQSGKTSPADTAPSLDISLPDLPEIKTLD